MTTQPEPVSTTEIADLLAWCRRLSDAGADADPADRAAYLAAKAGLLARIADEAAAHAQPAATLAVTPTLNMAGIREKQR